MHLSELIIIKKWYFNFCLLFFFFTAFACKPILRINADDTIILVEDNSSIENYQSKTICEKKYKDFANTDIEKLMSQVQEGSYEIASGSTYVYIRVVDAKTNTDKYSLTIDYGTYDPIRERLLNLLSDGCQK